MKSDARSRRQLELIAEYRCTGSEAAFLELLESVHGLIGMVIRRYAASHVHPEELSAEAMIGFMTALERFDPERGTFPATVHTYVRKVVYDCAQRLGRSTVASNSRQERALHSTGAALFRECLDVGIPASVAVDLVAESMGYDPQHVAAAMVLHQRIDWSIDETRGDDEDDERGDWLAAEEKSAEDVVTSSDRSRVLEEILAELPREQEVIIRRRLLVEDGQKRMNRGDIAAELGVYHRRIPQIEREGLAALRAGLDARGLTLADLI